MACIAKLSFRLASKKDAVWKFAVVNREHKQISKKSFSKNKQYDASVENYTTAVTILDIFNIGLVLCIFIQVLNISHPLC